MKPDYDITKSSLFALGKIQTGERLKKAIDNLSNMVGSTVEKAELERNIKYSYDNNKILYFKYSDSNTPVKTANFSNDCAVFGIDTGYLSKKDRSKILAQYSKTVGGWRGVFFTSSAQIIDTMQLYTIGALSFRDYEKANTFICNLKSMLLPGETWKYKKSSIILGRSKTEFQILESYLGVISSFLVQENNRTDSKNAGKIRFSKDKKYATFNSGLLSDKVTDIFILGEVKASTDSEELRILNPWILTGGRTELKKYGFASDVLSTDMANFFEDLSDIVYNAELDVDVDDYDKLCHCIDDGIARNRFPEEYKKVWESGSKDDIIDKFKQAIVRAQKIARRNYKYVVPQYRPSKDGKGSIQFLMPIYFKSNYSKAPDFALVLSKDETFYRLETVLELSWAYNNARVLCKPDNTWLIPEAIEESDSLEG